MGVGILPTPAIGGVGLLADVDKDRLARVSSGAGEAILLIGGAPGWLGHSAWLATICGREEGAPPPVDLAAERRNGDFVAVADRAGQGRARCTTSPTAASPSRWRKWRSPAGSARRSTQRAVEGPPHAFFFGEDQGRYVVTAKAEDAPAILAAAAQAGVAATRIGATGGDALDLAGRSADSGGRAPRGVRILVAAFMDGPGGELA